MGKLLKIYTRTGDKGQTSLTDGTRVLKSDQRVEAYGTIDELNSALGIVIAGIHEKNLKDELTNIQHDLFAIGSLLANPKNPSEPFLSERVKKFEKLIDAMTEKLPPLRNFILPGGGITGAHLHYARTVCRRAERQVVNLSQSQHIDDAIRIYVNRLSDLLFTMARFINHSEHQPETLWVKSV